MQQQVLAYERNTIIGPLGTGAPRGDLSGCVRPRKSILLWCNERTWEAPVSCRSGAFPSVHGPTEIRPRHAALGLPRGRLPASTEGQFSMNIRHSLTDYSATSTAPSAISATPSQLTMVSFSPSNKLPKIATSTTLSLSTGATCAALPSLSARK